MSITTPIFTIAKDLNLESNRIILACKKLGINAKGATKRLNKEEVQKIKSYFETGKNASDEVVNLNKINYYLCPNLNKWQLETLNLLGIKKNQCLSSVKYRHIKSDQIIVTTHPWQTSKNVVKDIENLPLWIMLIFPERFLGTPSA